VEIDLAEDDVRVLRHFVFDEEVVNNTHSYISYPGTTQSRESQYLNTFDIYYHIKMLMGKVLVESHRAHQEILIQLDDVQLQINLVDHKIIFWKRS
jgi:hypothetical protein